MFNSPRPLSEILKRDGNNFDVLRLMAALAVIVGHAYAIAPQPPLQDGILSLLHFDYSGSLAVKFFFFLSGLLVTNSIISRPRVFLFLAKRVLRIFPGLLMCLSIAVFIVGPLYTKLPLAEYFSTGATWQYLYKNLFLTDLIWNLPGVLIDGKLSINGSLWTLPHEMLCYIYLAIFFGLGLLKKKTAANIFFIAVVATSFLAHDYLPAYFRQTPESYLLPGLFSLGALFAVNKQSININVSQALLLWLLVIVLRNSPAYQFLFYVALFHTAIFISSIRFVIHRLKLPFDASYGVYVYGFMIQRCVHASFPGMGVHGNQLVSAIIALLMGILSWNLIERRCIEFGNKLADNNYLATLKNKISRPAENFFSNPDIRRSLAENGIFGFFILMILAFIIHVIVLKFIFPGYYSPLYPQHSDFYIPVAFANDPGPTYSFISLLSWPRPIYLIFDKFIGYFGFQGSIACVIAVVFMNCVLAALLIKRIFKLAFNWQLLILFSLYCFLLFSQPYLYTFYTQDVGAQLSFFLLLIGAHFYYSTFEKSVILSNGILFCFSALAFLSKETYAPTALIFCGLWFIYYRRTSFLKASLPFVMVCVAVIIAFVFNIFIKSIFVNLHATTVDPYHIDLSPKSVLHEWLAYAKESLNLVNVTLMLLASYLIYKDANAKRKELIYITIGCIAGALISWLPNAILPNHHYKGYSFNGTYLLYLPLLFLPVIWVRKSVRNGVFVAIILLGCVSPLFNISKYKDTSNSWVLIQETTQRNLLNALAPLINNLTPAETPQKILIEGITFPFHPFAFPESIRAFGHAKYANFDVVNYNYSLPNAQREDLVKFIYPNEILMGGYQQKWVFNDAGKLVKSVNLLEERLSGNINSGSVILPAGDSGRIRIDWENLSYFSTGGFYGPENGIRWTNGNAFINLNGVIGSKDSLVMQLNTYMPSICKNVTPKLSVLDTRNMEHQPVLSTRKDNTFYYLFLMGKKDSVQKISISSETITASNDQRVLSFPFVSLEIKN